MELLLKLAVDNIGTKGVQVRANSSDILQYVQCHTPNFRYRLFIVPVDDDSTRLSR